MTPTKYQGVFYRDSQDGTRTFYIRYKHKGVSIRTVIGTKAEGITAKYASNILAETKVKLRLGESAPIKRDNNVVTLDMAAKEYFDDRSEVKSIKNLKSIYATHLAAKGRVDITNIDDKFIEELKKKLMKKKSTSTKRQISAKTVNNVLSLLSAIMNLAHKCGDITQPIRITKLKINNSRDRFLSTTEIQLLLNKLENSELYTAKRLLLFTKLSLVTGGRLGSIIGIQGKHINMATKTVMLHNYKTNSDYTAFLEGMNVMDMIPELQPGEYLFSMATDIYKPMAVKQIQRPLQGILNTLFNQGLDVEDSKHRVVIHSLRHTYASHLAINGTPIQTIMKLMDHGDIAMTMRYAKLMPDSGRDNVAGLYQ